MAIALDTSTNGGTATATTLTFAHTCTGSNLLLIVGYTTNKADNTDYVTGITYNSVTMTRLNVFRSPGTGAVGAFYLLAPATGANNVVITQSASQEVYGVAASYTGVKQTGNPEADNNQAVDPTTAFTTNVTTIADNAWLVSVAGKKAGATGTLSAGANTTSRQVNTYVAIGDTNAAQTPPGSFGQTWNLSVSSGMAVIMGSFAPVLAAGAGYTSSPFMTGNNSFRGPTA